MLALLACGTAIYWAAANGYLKRPLISVVSAQLGRAVAVDGEVRIEFGRVTRLTASGLRLANVSWGTRPQMLLARYALLDLDTRSLLQSTIVIRKLVVAGLDLQLERNAAGQNNWTFKLPRRAPTAQLPVIIERAALPGAKVRFAGPAMERPLEVALDSADQVERVDGMLDLAARGTANLTPLEIRMSVGPVANLIAASHLKIQADGRIGDIALSVNGHIDSLKSPANSTAHINLTAPDATYLSEHLGLRRLESGPVALEMTVTPVANAVGVQGRLSGQIGGFEVSGQGAYVQQAKTASISVLARINGPDLSRIGHIVGIRGLPPERFQLLLDAQRNGDTVRIQDAQLALLDGRLKISGFLGPRGNVEGSELAFAVSIPEVAKIERRFGVTTVLNGPFEATGTLHHSKSGETRLQFNGTSTVGKFTLAGPIGRAPDFYGTRLDFSADGPDFAPLGQVVKMAEPLVGTFQSSGSAEWNRTGITLRNASLKIGDETLKVDGLLGRPPYFRGSDVHVDLTGSDSARFARRIGIARFPAAGYRIEGRLQREQDRTVLRKLKATVSGASLELDGTVGDWPGLSATSVDFAVRGPALENFSGLYPSVTLPRGSFHAAGHIVVIGNRLQVRDIPVAVADAQGTITATWALPLSSAALEFEGNGRVPDLSGLYPDLAGAATLPKNVEFHIAGSRLKDRWSLERVRLASGSDYISAVGELGIAPRLAARDVRLTTRIASLYKAGVPSGHHWPDQSMELSAQLTSADKDLTLENINGRIGTSDFAGRIETHGLGAAPVFDVQLDCRQLDLRPYIEPKAAPPAPAAAKARKAGAMVIPADELQLPDFQGINGKVALRAQTVRMREIDFRDLQIVATLRDSHLHVDPLKMTGDSGQVTARIDLLSKDKKIVAQLSGTAKNLRLSPVLVRASGPNDTVYSARVEARGSGGTAREIAGTLNGRLRLVGVGGRLANSGLMAGTNEFAKQLLTSLNPLASRQPTTEVECVAYLLSARDGVVTTDPALVMRTAGVDIVSTGLADLHTEKIDVNFKITGRKGLGIGVAQLINPYLKVTGTLAKPGVTLDPTGALVNGGAAFATAGLSVVATTVWDRIVHEKDPCAAAVAQSDRRPWD